MNLKQKLLDLQLVANNEYLDKYVKLIEDNSVTIKESFITQEHHIVPIYYFTKQNKEVDNSKENKVHLKFADHLLAHYYLMKCSYSTEYELANTNAINQMVANPHSVDLENWILKNRKLLTLVNKRRCELISLHHVDVSGASNPRATNVYQYSLTGKLEFVFPLISDCAKALNWKRGSLSTMLSKHKILLIGNKIYSKLDKINQKELENYLNYRKKIENSKRIEVEFVCEACGKHYKMKLSKLHPKQVDHHYCYKCTKSGVIFSGKHKSDEQKNKMRESCSERRKIRCIETGEVFDSIKAATRKYKGNIRGCVNKKAKTANGYHWEAV